MIRGWGILPWALEDHLQRLVIDRLRGSVGGWEVNHSQKERHSHPQRQGSRRPACEVGCLPERGQGLASRQELSVGVLIKGIVQLSMRRLNKSGVLKIK